MLIHGVYSHYNVTDITLQYYCGIMDISNSVKLQNSVVNLKLLHEAATLWSCASCIAAILENTNVNVRNCRLLLPLQECLRMCRNDMGVVAVEASFT